MSNKRFKMRGTENTNRYHGGLLWNQLALFGVRVVLPDSMYRLRLEPNNAEAATILAETLTRSDGWKQPGDNDQDRFSKVVTEAELPEALRTVAAAMIDGSQVFLNENFEEQPERVVRTALVPTVRAIRQTPGANSASRWHTQTLVRHFIVHA